MTTLEEIDDLLPQTQCRQCGCDGCLAYARAILEEGAAQTITMPTLPNSSRQQPNTSPTPLSEDIGRVKIPNMLRKRFGQGIQIDMVSGTDFPEDLTPYDLIIHCGACMFNRKYVLSRIEAARKQQVPMTNYGVTIACLQGILDKIDY